MYQEATEEWGEDKEDLDPEVLGQSTDCRMCAATTARGLNTTQEPAPYAAETQVNIFGREVTNDRVDHQVPLGMHQRDQGWVM